MASWSSGLTREVHSGLYRSFYREYFEKSQTIVWKMDKGALPHPPPPKKKTKQNKTTTKKQQQQKTN